MYNVVWCCCCRWEGAQERCTFPHPARRTAKPRHSTRSRQDQNTTRLLWTHTLCCFWPCLQCFDFSSLPDYLSFQFLLSCTAIAHADRPIHLDPELQARERKAKKGDMAVSGRPTGAFATARLLNARGWPHLSHHTQFACCVWPPSKRGTSRILNDERAGGVQGSS